MAKHALVVDDEQEDLNTMKGILEKDVYEVATVTNGTDALDHLTGDNVDLILIDIRMPTLSGYELLRLMREKINHKAKLTSDLDEITKGKLDIQLQGSRIDEVNTLTNSLSLSF
ncbi:MAG: response regulator [Nanoarchaeota archaeon]|nr:response regulator [Nanoarchaeota archaeon]